MATSIWIALLSLVGAIMGGAGIVWSHWRTLQGDIAASPVAALEPTLMSEEERSLELAWVDLNDIETAYGLDPTPSTVSSRI